MKKIIIILCFINTILFAEESVVFNFSVIPGINIIPGDHNTLVATGLISSDIYELDGVQAGPVFSTTKSDMSGVQASGVFNIVNGEANGVQAAGVYNFLKGNFDGVQASGVLNIVNGETFIGLQAAGVHNSVKDFGGLQVAGVSNITQDLDGMQASGVLNYAKIVDGFQTSGVINIASDLDGFQAAGVANLTTDGDGMQVAGVVNIAKNFNGLQVGVINIVSESSNGSVPIGILNLYKDGIKDVSAWIDDNHILNLGIETGGKNVYTLLYTGTEIEDTFRLNSRTFGVGLGYRLFPESLINFDIVAGTKYEVNGLHNKNTYNSYGKNWTPELKTSASLKLGNIALTGGVICNFKIDGYNDEAQFFKNKKNFVIDSDIDLNVYYNFFVGGKLSL